MPMENEIIRTLYDEHQRTLNMINYDRTEYEKSDFYEEQKARATNLQTRLETLKRMEKLVDYYPGFLSEDKKGDNYATRSTHD